MAKSDDSYTNDGQQMNGIYYPETNTEGEVEASVEKAKLESSFPVIEDLIEWFDIQIDLCDSIDNINLVTWNVNGVEIGTKVGIEAQIYGYQLLKQKLEEKKREYENFIQEKKYDS